MQDKKVENVSDLKIIEFKFEDVRPPFTKEDKKGYVRYGKMNDYPNYLLGLFDKSSKHAAIVQGKADFIKGNGFAFKDENNSIQNDKTETLLKRANNDGESLTEVLGKAAFDLELFGGCYLEIHFNQLEKVSEIYHLDFSYVRPNKPETKFFYAEDWLIENEGGSITENSKVNPEIIDAFDPKNLTGKKVLFIKEYKPGQKTFPLPNYFPTLRYIQVDSNISEFHLNGTNNGMFTSKMINFNNGVPTPDDQKEIEKKVNGKFAGTKNAGKIMISFSKNGENAPTVVDLSGTELDKHFDLLNKTVQQEIFSGHRVTSPMIFGIKTEGQLGGRAELIDAFELFQNTYVNGKRELFEKHFNNILSINGIAEVYLQKSEPIGFTLSQTAIDASLTEDEKREKLGLKPRSQEGENVNDALVKSINALSPLVANKVISSMTTNEIRAIANLPAIAGGDTVPTSATATTPGAFSSNDLDDDKDFLVFERFGKKKDLFEILHSRPVMYEDSLQFQRDYFAAVKDITDTQKSVIDLLNKDNRIQAPSIAEVLGISTSAVNSILKDLQVRNLVKVNTEVTDSGETVQVRKPSSSARDIIGTDEPETTNVVVRYSYEGPEDSRNRPFCAKMVRLDKLFSRKDIEAISAELGYSVWHRRGGWYFDPETQKARPYCRHSWAMNTVIEKSE